MKPNRYNFDQVIDRKNTDSLKYDFAERRGMPSDLLPLWVADMDFKVADEITEALSRSVSHGIYGYTEPQDSYFQAVSSWMKVRHSFEVEEKWLVRTPGVVFAIAMAVQAYTQKGDSVMIQSPVYYPFSQTILDNERNLVENSLKPDAQGVYQIDFEDFERKIIENQVRLFLLCSPHNPVSRVWTRDELKKIAAICVKYNVIVFSDEIHMDFVYAPNKHTVFSTLDEEIRKLTIVATAPSKTFNLAGLQVSNLFIADRVLRNKMIHQIRACGYSQLNTLGLAACRAAYEHGAQWLDELLVYLQGNYELLKSFIEKELPQVKVIQLQGTYLVWLDFRGCGLTDKEINERMVHKAKLWLDGGTMFGQEGNGYQRINITCPRSVLTQALWQMKEAFSD